MPIPTGGSAATVRTESWGRALSGRIDPHFAPDPTPHIVWDGQGDFMKFGETESSRFREIWMHCSTVTTVWTARPMSKFCGSRTVTFWSANSFFKCRIQ
jgi:hypothetical protein